MKQFLKDFWLWILLVIGGRNIKLATSWNELTERQLQNIASALEKFFRFRECYPEDSQPALFSRLYISLVKTLLRTNNMIKTWVALKQIPPEEYREHVEFLLKEVSRTKFPDAFKLKGKTYHPPGNRLNNISIREFSFVDSMWFNWKKTNDTRYLDLLCAALYRKAPEGRPQNELDIRKPFNKILVEQEVERFQKLPKKKKLAIAYTYEGSRNYIVKLYPHVFPPPRKKTEEELEAESQKLKAKSQEPKYTPFGRLLQHKIQFDPSKLERTQNLNVNEFLSTYENELIELKKQKKHA